MATVLIFVLLVSFNSISLQAQLSSNYHAIPILDTIPPSYLAALQRKLLADKASLKDPNKGVNTSIQEYLSHRTDYVISAFNEDYLIAEGEMVQYLQGILKNIYKRNPHLPSETNVFIYRSNAVNAMSFGEGTIAFTLGLLARLETEEQIMFVLCHELAHYHAKHSESSIVSLARLYNDKDFKKQVKSINRSDYNQFTRYSQLSRTLELSITHHGREKEFEADSIALVYYLNASNELRSPIRTLEILDSADAPLYKQNLDLENLLGTEPYPFKKQWLAYTHTASWHTAEEENDSLATHPGCDRRIAALTRQLQRHEVGLTSEPAINRYQEISRFEMVASGYHFKNYGRTLFEALVLSTQYPDNIFLKAAIGKCIYQQYVYQKNHELGKVLSLPDSRFPENYDRYLTFMHTIRLGELAALSHYYLATRKEKYASDEEFLFAYWMATHTAIGSDTPDQIKRDYVKRFPSGKYITSLR